MPIIVGNIQALLTNDNTTLNTTSTAFTVEKFFYFTDLNGKIHQIVPIVSLWSANAAATATVEVSVDNTVTAGASTNSTTETSISLDTLKVPSSSTGIHIFQLKLKTSNASYSAYTSLLEVIGE